MAEVTAEQTPQELVAIGEQFELVRSLRRQVRVETRQLAVMLRDTRDSDDDSVHPTAAARVMGTSKTYPHELIGKLEAGKLDSE